MILHQAAEEYEAAYCLPDPGYCPASSDGQRLHCWDSWKRVSENGPRTGLGYFGHDGSRLRKAEAGMQSQTVPMPLSQICAASCALCRLKSIGKANEGRHIYACRGGASIQMKLYAAVP